MKAALQDIVKKIGGLGFVDSIKVTGTADATKIEAIDGDKTTIIKATLNAPEADLVGEFGISNLSLLAGLLNHASYKTDEAKFTVKTRTVGDKTAPEEFQFTDATGRGAVVRLMDSKLVPEQPLVADIKWDITFVPTKSKIEEFRSLSSLYSSVDTFFSAKTDGDGNLIFAIGDSGVATHHADMVFAEGLEGELKGDLLWPISQFMTILKTGDGHDYTVSLTSKGAMLVNVVTDQANYQFILPARRR